MLNVLNEAVGLIAVRYEIEPVAISDRPLEELNNAELGAILQEHAGRKLKVFVRDYLSAVDASLFTTVPLSQVLSGRSIPAELADSTINDISDEAILELLVSNLSTEELRELVLTEVVGLEVLESWPVTESLFNRAAIEERVATEYPGAELQTHSWISANFLSSPMSSVPAQAGIRTALLGSLWVLAITMAVAFPLGLGAAIYLQEYSSDNFFNRLIDTNVRNLAGVPSIIYGILGLAIFVRTLEAITSGSAFGVTDSNGRTILSAGLTMALLILPIIIINAQEALRAVPRSLREASYGLGATQWQTILNTVLPAAIPGILTGTILAMSRAVGETAPLIVIGASTFIVFDPNGPFSKFTALPIQIYQWTARPQDQFRDIAAAAIVILLVLLLTLNAAAIILRNRYSGKLA
ncbi:MAG: phosphate ABC transporter permease PstA [Burkholderiales bacterium]|nr:phosphate ABC transporter permease PstA [Anaerolineae bacterium]